MPYLSRATLAAWTFADPGCIAEAFSSADGEFTTGAWKRYRGLVPLDAIVLLGCRIGPNDRPTAAAQRRAARAARAWHEGLAPIVVVTGGRQWKGVCEADALGRELLAAAVSSEALVLERRSLSTRQNARYAAQILRDLGASRAGIVTCDWHMPRALRAFRRAGIEADAVPAPAPPVGRLQRWLRNSRERVSSMVDTVVDWGLPRS